MHALILANGDRPSEELLMRLMAESDLFIAADGAANGLVALGLSPDVVLGDFDSLDASVRAALGSAQFVTASDQNASDLDKAIAYARERGADRITVAGASGGRIDHALTNVSLLLKYGAEARIRIVGDASECVPVFDSTELRGQIGDTLSVVAFAPAEGVTIEGAEWPLRDATLLPGSRGVSNVFVTETVRIAVRSGSLIVCRLCGEKAGALAGG